MGEALDEICSQETLLVVPTPAGRLFTQATAQRWSGESHLVFACGRYEGIDQRVMDDAARRMRVEEVSIGDYVLPGGESAALVMIEAVVRLLPDVLGNPASHQDRFAFRRSARGPQLHPAAELARPGCAGRAAVGRPREGGGVAAGTGAGAHRERRPDLVGDD